MGLNDRTLDNYRPPDKAKNTIFRIKGREDHKILWDTIIEPCFGRVRLPKDPRVWSEG